MRVVVKEWLTPLSILVLAGAIVHDRTPPRLRREAGPPGKGVTLGQAYAPVLVAGYADAWLAAASAIEEGKTVSEAQRVLQETWTSARIHAFRKDVEPVFARVLPEGTEPADAAKRAEVADLWRSFAKGLTRGL